MIGRTGSAERRIAVAVDSFWVAERPGSAEDEWILPSGRGQIVVDLAEATGQLIGPRTKPVRITAPRRAAGMALTGVGTYSIVGESVGELLDTAVDLGSIHRDWERGLSGSGQETIEWIRRLAGRILQWDVADDIVAVETGLRRGDQATVADAMAGVDRRRFVPRFRLVVGLGLKHYERLQRFQRAVKVLRRNSNVSLAELAVSLGYYDHAHLANDLRAFGDCPPSLLRDLVDDGRPNHLPAVPSGAVTPDGTELHGPADTG